MDIFVISDSSMRPCLRCGKLTIRLYYCGECMIGIAEEQQEIEKDHLGLQEVSETNDLEEGDLDYRDWEETKKLEE